MRQADDLADDESLSIEERRTRLAAWMKAWRMASGGGETQDPVFVAVRDATIRYAIPVRLLEELVDGVTMDLGGANTLECYATFDELYRYCYLVASVVGLVCIRIFGYSDVRAEKLAEETGIAFQLTNILRDVQEDAERHRVYLPMEDLKTYGITVDGLLLRAKGTKPSAAERALLQEIGRRAERYYASAQALMSLIDKDSRPALWVLVEIYHALLKQVEGADFDVFSRRAGVPTYKKIGILLIGLARMFWARMVA
jgi:phytoene synthase